MVKPNFSTAGDWIKTIEHQQENPGIFRYGKRNGKFNDQIIPNDGNLTVPELVEKYLSSKVNVRHNTRANYNFVQNILKKEAFGKMRIDKVKQSAAKAWLIKMQKVDGWGYSSIHCIRGVVRPTFEMALQDDLIRKNPFQFELATW